MSIIETFKRARREVQNTQADPLGYFPDRLVHAWLDRLPDELDVLAVLGLPDKEVIEAVDLVYNRVTEDDVPIHDLVAALEEVIDALQYMRAWALGMIAHEAPHLFAIVNLEHEDIGSLFDVLVMSFQPHVRAA